MIHQPALRKTSTVPDYTNYDDFFAEAEDYEHDDVASPADDDGDHEGTAALGAAASCSSISTMLESSESGPAQEQQQSQLQQPPTWSL